MDNTKRVHAWIFSRVSVGAVLGTKVLVQLVTSLPVAGPVLGMVEVLTYPFSF